jgi:uncharacterized lipoprotein
MNIKLLATFILAVLVTGCTTPPLTLNYAPTSTMTVEGEMSVGDFRYIPGETETIKPNQIKNTAMGSIIFEKNIDQYIETAVFTESRFVGIKLQDSATQVTGEINEFLIDDLGFSVDWTLDIRYMVDGCYDKTHRIEKTTGKFVNVFGSLNEVIKLNIEMLFEDSQFKSCIKI